MTTFMLSYLLLWLLAILLVVATAVILYLSAQLEAKSALVTQGATLSLSKAVGSKAPKFAGYHVATGEAWGIETFRDHAHVVLAISPRCQACARLVRELTAIPKKELEGVRLVLLCTGDFEMCSAAVSKVHSVTAIVRDASDMANSYSWLSAVPAALIVDERGVVLDAEHPTSIRAVLMKLNAIADTQTKSMIATTRGGRDAV
jgi:hypothetical protein